jgi:hypothetical protein
VPLAPVFRSTLQERRALDLELVQRPSTQGRAARATEFEFDEIIDIVVREHRPANLVLNKTCRMCGFGGIHHRYAARPRIVVAGERAPRTSGD